MKIGIDAKRAFCNATGLGNYARNFILSLATHYPEHTFYLFTSTIKIESFHTEVSLFTNIKVVTYATYFFRYWGITKFLNRNDISLFIGLSNELPVSIKKFKGKTVVVIHDLIPYKEDVFVKIPYIFFAKWKLKSAINAATKIVSISKATQLDIISKFEKQSDVIYPTFSELKFSKNYSNTDSSYTYPYFLQVGRMEYRKNIQSVLLAMNRIKANSDLHFVCIGKKTNFFASLYSYTINNKLDDRVHFIHDCNDEQLASYYSNAEFIIYPSKYEGFGFPIVEAIAHGKQIITTVGNPFEEAGGDLATYVDTSNPASIAETICKQSLTSYSENDAVLQLKKFSSEETMNSWEKIIKI